MSYFVYMLISHHNNKSYSYVGYTSDLKKRLADHNNSKGAKYTKGRIWGIIYKKKYLTKSKAMKEEYFLKKNTKLRSNIKKKYLIKNNA
jgi:putative endonuclease